jgi:PKD repeat protein
MKQLFTILIVFALVFQMNAYDKLSLVERLTNCSCGPCASINNAWYNASTAGMVSSGSISHIIYNVDWPSDTDPMHLLNQADNNTRRGYYGVNSVPWIEVNGATVSTTQGPFEAAINSGNQQFSAFNIILTPERFSNNVINVHVKIIRDTADVNTYSNTKLRVALTEKRVIFPSPPGSNGESVFFSVCRKMLPDGKGVEVAVPAVGDSVEYDLHYIPTQGFSQSVNFDSIRVVAFIQNDDTKQVYQSGNADLVSSNRVNAAFQVQETLGPPPYSVTFEDFSTATDSTSITTWEWDFDNDGIIDSQDPQPTWVFTNEQTYTVTLIVSDGIEQNRRTLENYIMVLGSSSDILVVNGIDYATYAAEMENFYSNSACFGNHQVDVWDLFGEQGFNYSANANIQQVNLLDRTIPNSILNLYSKVIWIGNNYSGDNAFYSSTQVLDYIGQGGHFLLATRTGTVFLTSDLRNYCGISSMSGDSQVSELIALDDSLVNMTALAGHTLVHYAQLGAGSEAIPIFDDNIGTTWTAGFRIQKSGDGAFIYIAGRPYRYDNTQSFQNYDFIIDNWLTDWVTGIDENNSTELLSEFRLLQNYPNPFNPSTKISYIVKNSNDVVLKIYDVLGREVTTLVNEFQKANIYTINFDASNYANGIYYYKLKIGDKFEQTKKMLYLK